MTPLPELARAAEAFGEEGRAAIALVEGHRVLAVFAIADAVRPESREAVRRLQDEGIEVAMVTGDSRAVAENVARDLGIDTVLAQVLPDEKAERVKALQAEGKRVAMVGDGVNDALALVTAMSALLLAPGQTSRSRPAMWCWCGPPARRASHRPSQPRELPQDGP